MAYVGTITVVMQTTDPLATFLVPELAPNTRKKTTSKRGMIALAKFIEAGAAGRSQMKMAVYVQGVAGVKASGTITFTGPSAGDTIVLAGITFTLRTLGTTDPTVLTDVPLGATDTATAANLVTKMNLHPVVSGIGVATSALGVVTWTANFPGLAPNTLGTMTKVGAQIALSAAVLASGTESAFNSAAFFPGDGP